MFFLKQFLCQTKFVLLVACSCNTVKFVFFKSNFCVGTRKFVLLVDTKLIPRVLKLRIKYTRVVVKGDEVAAKGQ